VSGSALICLVPKLVDTLPSLIGSANTAISPRRNCRFMPGGLRHKLAGPQSTIQKAPRKLSFSVIPPQLSASGQNQTEDPRRKPSPTQPVGWVPPLPRAGEGFEAAPPAAPRSHCGSGC
jgi:hypothetical protein